MLSNCAAFSGTLRHVEKVCGKTITVSGEITALDDRRIQMVLISQDVQNYTGPSGEHFTGNGKNISDLLTPPIMRYPGLRIKSVALTVTDGIHSFTDSVSCTPLNPELIATLSRKLLRKLANGN